MSILWDLRFTSSFFSGNELSIYHVSRRLWAVLDLRLRVSSVEELLELPVCDFLLSSFWYRLPLYLLSYSLLCCRSYVPFLVWFPFIYVLSVGYPSLLSHILLIINYTFEFYLYWAWLGMDMISHNHID